MQNPKKVAVESEEVFMKNKISRQIKTQTENCKSLFTDEELQTLNEDIKKIDEIDRKIQELENKE